MANNFSFNEQIDKTLDFQNENIKSNDKQCIKKLYSAFMENLSGMTDMTNEQIITVNGTNSEILIHRRGNYSEVKSNPSAVCQKDKYLLVEEKCNSEKCSSLLFSSNDRTSNDWEVKFNPDLSWGFKEYKQYNSPQQLGIHTTPTFKISDFFKATTEQ